MWVSNNWDFFLPQSVIIIFFVKYPKFLRIIDKNIYKKVSDVSNDRDFVIQFNEKFLFGNTQNFHKTSYFPKNTKSFDVWQNIYQTIEKFS